MVRDVQVRDLVPRYSNKPQDFASVEDIYLR